MVELSIVLAVITIIATVATPNFITWLSNLRFQKVSQDIIYDLQLAKSSSIKRNSNIVFLINNFTCSSPPTPVPIPGGGYTIFIDDGNGGGSAGDDILTPGESVLKTVLMPLDVALCKNIDPSDDFAGNLITFLPTGLPKDGNTGTIRVNNNTFRQADISVNISGYIKSN